MAGGDSLLNVSRAGRDCQSAKPSASVRCAVGRPRADHHRRRRAATPVLRRAVAAFASPEVAVEQMLRWGWLASRAANLLWDHDRSLEIGERAVQLARDSGALEALAVADNA